MIGKELFDIYKRFHNEKGKVAEDEMVYVKALLTNMGMIKKSQWIEKEDKNERP